jgi:hypothetical protein
LIIDPGTGIEISTKMTLFPTKKLFLEKNQPQSQGQISKLKNLNKISKLQALERFFFIGRTTSKLFDPELYGKGLWYKNL